MPSMSLSQGTMVAMRSLWTRQAKAYSWSSLVLATCIPLVSVTGFRHPMQKIHSWARAPCWFMKSFQLQLSATVISAERQQTSYQADSGKNILHWLLCMGQWIAESGVCVCVCVCVYIYIYIDIYTHTYTCSRGSCLPAACTLIDFAKRAWRDIFNHTASACGHALFL